ncbi:16S rRNA (cytosine967-C5)-methyltransferase [Litorimonas taeanensis]|uniref:16S rRNA (Cytosine967-C5)-methyltransferase n=1 Tax=Litorimonas taeanensis TaxID=568099 RepID=A0A420WE83_9PROT|nr:RsmB/NOP family class I SAM-dependent RNA methyltransferase [Litorimonas taeanensis]RKQ69329.1 16S rRNA (cytosine967-C5)-methyltransferase [Litorimonas taeanensis]
MNDRPHKPRPRNTSSGKGFSPHGRKRGDDKRRDDNRGNDRRPAFIERPLSSAQMTRQCAASAVRNVKQDGLPLETVLSALPEYNDLDPRDRAFARLIAATTFRRAGQIKAALKPLIRKAPPAFIQAVLETAAAQILFLGTPAHAAVGETVELLKAKKATAGFANMANAVLRKVVTDGPRLAGAEAPRANIPGWIRGAWERSYGRPAVRKISLQLIKDPPLDLTLKDETKANTDKWAETLGGKAISPGTVRLPNIGNVAALEGYSTGEWWAQDIAASLPVRFLSDHLEGKLQDKAVLDLCAAPGGKTLQLAAMGAKVTALDKSETRLERLHENLERTQLKANVVCADALEWETQDRFDIILLDAPCTATGTFRRHPDVLYNRTPKTLSQLVRLQDKLLPKAATLLKPGGLLVFATCSLQPEEGEPRVIRFLGERPDFRPISIVASKRIEALKDAEIGLGVRTFPYFQSENGGMDGFYMAILQASLEK